MTRLPSLIEISVPDSQLATFSGQLKPGTTVQATVIRVIPATDQVLLRLGRSEVWARFSPVMPLTELQPGTQARFEVADVKPGLLHLRLIQSDVPAKTNPIPRLLQDMQLPATEPWPSIVKALLLEGAPLSRGLVEQIKAVLEHPDLGVFQHPASFERPTSDIYISRVGKRNQPDTSTRMSPSPTNQQTPQPRVEGDSRTSSTSGHINSTRRSALLPEGTLSASEDTQSTINRSSSASEPTQSLPDRIRFAPTPTHSVPGHRQLVPKQVSSPPERDHPVSKQKHTRASTPTPPWADHGLSSATDAESTVSREMLLRAAVLLVMRKQPLTPTTVERLAHYLASRPQLADLLAPALGLDRESLISILDSTPAAREGENLPPQQQNLPPQQQSLPPRQQKGSLPEPHDHTQHIPSKEEILASSAGVPAQGNRDTGAMGKLLAATSPLAHTWPHQLATLRRLIATAWINHVAADAGRMPTSRPASGKHSCASTPPPASPVQKGRDHVPANPQMEASTFRVTSHPVQQAVERLFQQSIINQSPAPDTGMVQETDLQVLELPLVWNGNLHTVLLTIRRESQGHQKNRRSRRQENERATVTLTVHAFTPSLGPVEAVLTCTGNRLACRVTCQTSNGYRWLRKHQARLQNRLAQLGFEGLSLTVSPTPQEPARPPGTNFNQMPSIAKCLRNAADRQDVSRDLQRSLEVDMRV